MLLYKGDPRPTTAQPKATGARIRARTPSIEAIAGRRPAPLTLEVQNTAETRWLAGEGDGWTRLGAHLYRDEAAGELFDYDWLRVALPKDVEQYERVVLTVELPALPQPGTYRAEFDLVLEGVMWFGDRGSPTTSVTVIVT